MTIALVGCGYGVVASAVFALLRGLELVALAPELAIATRCIGSSGTIGWVAGALGFWACLGIGALAIVAVLRHCRWTGSRAGALVAFILWHATSLGLAPFPRFDLWTPEGLPGIGPLGIHGGPNTFVTLILFHVYFGAIVGATLARLCPSEPPGESGLVFDD